MSSLPIDNGALTEALKDRYRVLAINLFGYGDTTPWPAASPQSQCAQAQLVMAVCEVAGSPVHLVGHSFGGAVALKDGAAAWPPGWQPGAART